jgi:hypothetical protein
VTDAVTLLLTIGAVVGVALLAQRIKIHQEEKTADSRSGDRPRGRRWLADQGSAPSRRIAGGDGQAV